MIISEYYLISELFFARRFSVLMISLTATIFFIFLSIRFFKKFILPAKASNVQS